MNLTKPFFLLVFATVILGMVSCRKDTEFSKKNEETTTNQSPTEGMTRLGKKLENPYAVENMRKAYENLKSGKSAIKTANEGIDIHVTHLYIRFKPKTEDELAILKTDSSLILYEYPLDYEIIQGGSYYHDPEVPVGTPTYQYASVPVNQKLPEGIVYETLAQLFIPDEGKDPNANTTASEKTASADLIDALVTEALRITNNLEKTKSGTKTLGSKWRPAGRIRVWDDVINNWRGVEGVEVKARRWFTTHEGITDANGYYSCNGTFKNDANYSIDWERYHFALRDGWLNGAEYDGPKKEGNWNLDLNSGYQQFLARIFMAAYHYYYKDIKGLRRPPENGFWKTQMRIRAYNETNGDNGNCDPLRGFLGLGSQIKLYNPQRRMDEIYGTTIHELAHASHWNMSSGGDYTNSEDKVAESWARGVQWELTRMVWNDYQAPRGPLPKYTLVVVDLIDPIIGDNLTLNDFNDPVEGYSIRQIEDALKGQRTWDGWRNNIINKYNNPTEQHVTNLFASW